jgi:hypothetical protein
VACGPTGGGSCGRATCRENARPSRRGPPVPAGRLVGAGDGRQPRDDDDLAGGRIVFRPGAALPAPKPTLR